MKEFESHFGRRKLTEGCVEMNQVKNLLFIMGSLFVMVILSACSPTQTELDTTATQAAAPIFATQTAEALSATLTSTNTPTPTDTPTATPTLSAQEMADEYFQIQAPS